jgi:myo-inositol-1(or 4)-monophosphatase
MISHSDLKRYLDFAKETAVKAGGILQRKARVSNKISFKGRVNLVTEADLASEYFIIRAIEKKYPEHSILAEEESAKNNNSEFKWIIDPLDGTTNFAHGFPFYCVSIALEYKGNIIVGIVYDPLHDELFYAIRQGGSFLNGKRNKVTVEKDISRALLATGFPYDIGASDDDNLDNFARFAKVARGIRRPGSAALDLCYVACGRLDAFWELKLSPWDTAAGILIVQEAGGKVTDFTGGRYSIYGKYIIASNAHIHSRMVKALTA